MLEAPFELRIRITGLSLFLPKPRAMHVLMVKPKQHETHHPRVWYDEAHEDNNATTLSGMNRRKDLPKELDWSGLTVIGGSVQPLGKRVPNIADASGKELNLGTIQHITSHLTLPPGERTFRLAPPIWEWLGKHERIAQEVVWHVTVNQASLPGAGSLPTLYPIAGEIRLFMSNVIDRDSTFPPPLGRMPALNSAMAHFDAFYDLYEPPAFGGDRPAPIFKPSGLSTSYSCLPSQGK